MASPAQTKQRLVPTGVRRQLVAAIRHDRMLAATVDAVAEHGYERLTVAEIVGRARVSRKAFYEAFADREDCFLAVFEQTLDGASRLAREAYVGAPSWRCGTRLALARLLQLMDDESGLARLCLIEALVAGGRVRARRAQALAELALVIDRGRLPGVPGREPPQITAEGLVGGIVTVLHNRLLQRDGQPLADLLGPLMSMIVLPYEGPRAAKRELERPAPPARRRAPRRVTAPMPDPLQGLDMRLTYRTVRALRAIAEHPGASNREVADGSGIVDQGQISRLLNRLARLELVENRGEGTEKGASNAWHLTPNGARIERGTRVRR